MNEKIKEDILKLKKEKNAIILAHYYQNDDVKKLADEIGDSFYLSKVAKKCSEDIIVLCGVKFMAESAKILSPNKRVLIPEENALCPMAEMVQVNDVLDMKKAHPNAKVVCYINSNAEIKAVSDVCCTSTNAVQIVQNINAEEIIFVPDKNLGSYVQKQVSNKKVILWDGYCYIHNNIKVEDIQNLKSLHQGAPLLVHPECNKSVRNIADFMGSTGDMLKYVNNSDYKKYIVVTEKGIIYDMRKKNPHKHFISVDCMVCSDMKKITLNSIYESLHDMKYEINLDDNIIDKAKASLENMLLLGR